MLSPPPFNCPKWNYIICVSQCAEVTGRAGGAPAAGGAGQRAETGEWRDRSQVNNGQPRLSPAAGGGCRVAAQPRAPRQACASRRLAPGSCGAPRHRWAPARAARSVGEPGAGRAGIRDCEGMHRRSPNPHSRPPHTPAAPAHQGTGAAAPLCRYVALRAAFGRRLALVYLGREAQRAQRLLRAGQRGGGAQEQG